MHGSSHEGMVFWGERPLIFPAIIGVKQCVEGVASSGSASACPALLCWLV